MVEPDLPVPLNQSWINSPCAKYANQQKLAWGVFEAHLREILVLIFQVLPDSRFQFHKPEIERLRSGNPG